MIRPPRRAGDGASSVESAARRLERLRELLYGAPSVARWEAVLDVFTGWPEREGLAEGVEYAAGLLASWPDTVRVLPRRWTGLLRQHKPLPLSSRLARTLVLDPFLGEETLLALISSPWVDHLHHLEAPIDVLSPMLANAWVSAGHLTHLNGLTLRGAQDPALARDAVLVMISTPLMRRLTHLGMPRALMGPQPAQMIAAAGRRLESLDLSHNALTDWGLRHLSRSPHFSALRRLNLSGNGLGGRHALSSLGDARWFSGLTHLDLSDNPLTGSLEGLTGVAAPWSLRALSLNGSVTDADDLREALISLPLNDLRDFSMLDAAVGAQTLRAICAVPWLKKLTTLRLSLHRPGESAVTALMSALHGGHLRELTLSGDNGAFFSTARRWSSSFSAPIERLETPAREVTRQDAAQILQCAAFNTLKSWSTDLGARPGLGLAPWRSLDQARCPPSLTHLALHVGVLDDEATPSSGDERPFRGSIEEVTLVDGALTRRWHLDWLNEHPVTAVKSSNVLMSAEALAAIVADGRGDALRSLELHGAALDSAALSTLVRADLPSLKALALRNGALAEGSVAALTSAPWWPQLRALDLSKNRLNDAALEALTEGPSLKHLRHLDIRSGQLTSEGLRGLFERMEGGFAPSLQRLEVDAGLLTGYRAVSLREMARGWTRSSLPWEQISPWRGDEDEPSGWFGGS